MMYWGGSLYGMIDDDIPILEQWIVRDIDFNEVARVLWATTEPFPWSQIDHIPVIRQVRLAVQSAVGLQVSPTYNNDVWEIVGDDIALFEIHRVKAKKEITGYCQKCDEKGKFVRTALICPNCKALLGGF